ncbi:MFS transporter [Mesoaciditoga lauensis]|uniref:MFS transporter n=1 Tax=Mesoaciditoga lauensis TaxID=1495039 RepID=UPI00068C5482|nr:MFS transporter [Mesoaciditoga lauensis]
MRNSQSYRWVVALTAGAITATSFISLTSFSVATPFIAQTTGMRTELVNTIGVDAFSIALFVAFLMGSGGFFDTKIKLGVFIAQASLIIPQFLIPTLLSPWLLALLRFSQGLVIMMLALFSIQLTGWFKPTERALSLSFTMGAIPLGGAIGGISSSYFLKFGWQNMYYINGLFMLLGNVIYFGFSKTSKSFEEKVITSKAKVKVNIWTKKITWMMGFLPMPVAWSLFSMGGFLPTFGYHLGYKPSQIGTLMLTWGIAGGISCFVGAIIGDSLAKRKSSNQEIFHARLVVMLIANVLVGAGALLMLCLGSRSFGWLIVGAIINTFSQILAPNYWASLSNIFPPALIGVGAFALGLLSNIPSAVGPLISSWMINQTGWNGFFVVMIALAIVGILLGLFITHIDVLDKEEA